MSTLFISYRRSDSQVLAHKLYDRLTAAFPEHKSFIDIDSMPLGNDFPAVLASVLKESRIVLVVIGPNWETATDDDGARRLYCPQDFVRLEVESALKGEIAVVPVLVGGADFPDERKLPVSLRPLAHRHAIKLGDDVAFDRDVDRLFRGLTRLLSEGGLELPRDIGAHTAALDGQSEIIGRDRSFPLLDERIATGSPLVILCGPTGIGKTTTASVLATRHTPKLDRQHILWINAREELSELSLIEAVGEAYGDEFYRDRDQVPFTSLSFRRQRRLAVELLKNRKATVIIDDVGEATYPRNAAAELELARRLAKELAAESVLVLIATKEEAYWHDLHPIQLQGLAPNHARLLLQREFRKAAPGAQADDLARRLGGEPVFTKLIDRGCPDELIAAAVQAGAGADALPVNPEKGVFERTMDWLRHPMEALFGDPIHPPPAAARSAKGSGRLFAICTALQLIVFLCLIASYGSGSAFWKRMFYNLATPDSKIAPLDLAGASQLTPGPGLMVELARSAIIIFGHYCPVQLIEK